MATPVRRANYQDVLDAPPGRIAEVIDGELHLTRPRLTHASVGSRLMGHLLPRFQAGDGGPGGWIILHEPELHLADDILVPDLAGWRRERLPVIEDDPFTTLVPDWICEILSPSTEVTDRTAKLPIYAAAGVQHAWLIHPIRRTLEVMRLHEGRWLILATHCDDQRVRVDPFSAIELDLSMLWQALATPPRGERACEPMAPYDVRVRVHDDTYFERSY